MSSSSIQAQCWIYWNFEWAQHLWDTLSTSAFLPILFLCFFFSLCLRMRPSGVYWWSQACWLESARSRPVCVLEHNSLCIMPCFGHWAWLISLSRTFYIWNTPHLHLYRRAAQRPKSGIMNKIIISKYQLWNYPHFSVHVSASFTCGGRRGGGGGGGSRHWGLRSNCEKLSEGIRGGVWIVDSLAGKQESEERPLDFSPAMCKRKDSLSFCWLFFSPAL